MSAALCRLPRSAMLNSRPARQEDGFVKQGSHKISQAVGGGLRKEVLTLPGKTTPAKSESERIAVSKITLYAYEKDMYLLQLP